ncbi:MAG: hypothetical protein ACKV22_41230 [Bryobacteraceae bacterium]
MKVPQWLVPSLADILFLSLIAWPFFLSSSGWTELMADANSGIHIRTGEFILQTHTVPHQDLYSFSKPGAPWFAWEWLTTILYAQLHSAYGLASLAILSAFLIWTHPVLLLRNQMAEGASVAIALPLTLVAFRASSIHFLARPHLFTWLFFAITVALVNHDRRSRTRWLWALVPMSALWTNLHGGFLTLPVYAGLTAAGSLLEAVLTRHASRWTDFRRYSLLSALTAAATLLNPYGIRVHTHIVQMMQSQWLTKIVQEFQPPMRFPGERVYLYFAILAIALVCAAVLVRRGRFVEPLWIAFFAYASMTSARHLPLFFLAATPVCAQVLSEGWRRLAEKGGPKSLAGTLDSIARDAEPGFTRMSVWGPAFWLVLLLTPLRATVPSEFPATQFPAAIVNRHLEAIATSRIFTHDGWADYLIYRNYPRQRIFVDGRGDFFGPEIGEPYLDMLEAKPGWKEQFARWEFSMVLLKPGVALAKALGTDPEWMEIERDAQAVLFRKR